MTEMTIIEAINHTLEEAMANDDTVVVLGEDVGVDGGVFRATNGLIDEYEDRVMDTPLDEAGIIGTSIGMAAYGLKPIPEIQFSGFITQGFHQVKQHVSRMRMRTRDDITLPMVIRAPYGGGIKALEHHSESQESIYARMGGVKVVIPSTPTDTKGLLHAAIKDPDPVMFLEPKKIYRAVKEDVPEDVDVEIGDAAVRQDGSDLTVVSWGSMYHTAKQAVERVEADDDVDIELIDLRTINPLDEDTIVESVEKTGRLVVVSEENKMASIAAELCSLVAEKDLLHLQAPPNRVTGMDTPVPLYQLEDEFMPDEDRVVDGIRDTMTF